MSRDYCSQLGQFDCIHDFVVAIADGELTEDHRTRFEQFLLESDDACRLYCEYVQESDFLQTILDSMSDEDSPSPDVFALEPQGSPAPTFPATLFHATLGFFSSGWPVAYLIATVVVGVGLWISSVIPVFYPQQIAKRSSATRAIGSAPEPQMESVGRVTAMAECRWARDVVPLLVNDTVPVGCEVRLESGLMEIAYDSGAKVILQGPVTYEVDSVAGGYLSVGKLTARVEKKVASGQWPVASEKSEIRNPKSEISNPQSPAPRLPSPAPLFSVRTPTAIVTDLGTEFGIDVDKHGVTETHVFEGTVIAARTDLTVGGTLRQTLTAGEGARIERDQVVMIGPKSHAGRFMRSISQPQKVKFLGPVPYQSFENREATPNISPFSKAAGGPFGPLLGGKGQRHWTGPDGQYFYLEDFESGEMRAVGLSRMGGLMRGGALRAKYTDSVDEDDGVIDNASNGALTHTLKIDGNGSALTFWFNVSSLGRLPNHVGFVITDCGRNSSTTVRVYDASDRLLVKKRLDHNTFATGEHACGPGSSEKARFVGIVLPPGRDTRGIASVFLTDVTLDGRYAKFGTEIDHIQYGFALPAENAPANEEDGSRAGDRGEPAPDARKAK